MKRRICSFLLTLLVLAAFSVPCLAAAEPASVLSPEDPGSITPSKLLVTKTISSTALVENGEYDVTLTLKGENVGGDQDSNGVYTRERLSPNFEFMEFVSCTGGEPEIDESSIEWMIDDIWTTPVSLVYKIKLKSGWNDSEQRDSRDYDGRLETTRDDEEWDNGIWSYHEEPLADIPVVAIEYTVPGPALDKTVSPGTVKEQGIYEVKLSITGNDIPLASSSSSLSRPMSGYLGFGDAKVRDRVSDNFEILEFVSWSTENKPTTDSALDIKWDIGFLNGKTETLTYKIRLKDDWTDSGNRDSGNDDLKLETNQFAYVSYFIYDYYSLGYSDDIKKYFPIPSITYQTEEPVITPPVVTPPVVVTAVQDPVVYFKLSTGIQGQGSVLPSDSTTLQKGTTVQLTATPAAGWEFAGWQGANRSEVNGSNQLYMDSDKSVIAVFTQIPPVIAVPASQPPVQVETVIEEVTEEAIPEEAPVITVPAEEAPAAASLPATGGIPPGTLYCFGGLVVTAGMLIRRRDGK